MDPLTHLLITRQIIGPDRKTILAGLAADVPFYLTYPVLLSVTLVIRRIRKRWPREALAWGLHILVDLPTHSRQQWAPQFLWPLSTVTVDGVSWTGVMLSMANGLLKWLR